MSAIVDRLPGPILVVGGYGYHNLGDEAILAGLLARLGTRPGSRGVTVVSRDPQATSRLHGVRAIGLAAAIAALPRHASLLIGGGGLFGRDMGRIGRLLPAYGLAATAIGRQVIVDGVDLDERLAPSARRLVPALMRRAARVTVRDRRSAAILERWGVRAHLAPDLSWWMPAAPTEEGRQALLAAGVDLRRPAVGLSLSGVRRASADVALHAVVAAMDALPDVQFAFVPMSRHPYVSSHDDLKLARRLQAVRPRLLVVEQELHPAAVLAVFGQLSAVVAMRYHAMLFAHRMGIPLVPLAYAEKNLRWLAEQGLRPVAPDPALLTAAVWTALARDERATFRVGPVAALVAAS